MTTTDREQWLKQRRQGIGGSDVAGILGISPWSSPWSTWADKTGLLPPEPENQAMTAGRWLEAAIGPWFTHETGLHVAGEQTLCTHQDHSHHLATIDGGVFEHEIDPLDQLADIAEDPGCTMTEMIQAIIVEQALGLLEIKVTGPGRRWDQLPDYYQAQGQWQMHVTGLDQVWFAVLMGRRLDIHELTRDQGDIDFMADRVDAFWRDHVLAGEPPPVDGSDATTRALAAAYPDGARGDALDADTTLAGEVAQWKAARQARLEAERQEKHWANTVRAGLGDATEVHVDGHLAASWRPQTTRRLDQKALKARLPRTARRFTTESTSRVLRPHAPSPKETS